MITTEPGVSCGDLGLLALTRVLQLASPTLPIGAYAYSEGIEYAVERGQIPDADGALAWVGGLLAHGFGRVDVPFFSRIYDAWGGGDAGSARRLSRRLLAHRETAELRASDRRLGQALARLLRSIPPPVRGSAPDAPLEDWQRSPDATYVAMFAYACRRFSIGRQPGACALAWSWAENLVTAAVKLVPLGQSHGQRILFELGERIPGVCLQGLRLADDDIGGSAMGAAIASAGHEHQHTRLFRS